MLDPTDSTSGDASIERVLQDAPIVATAKVDGHALTYVVTFEDGTRAMVKHRGDVSNRHERAAWIVNRSLGWGLVPPVVLRSEEIAGENREWSVALFVEGADNAPTNCAFEAEVSLCAAALDYLVFVWDRQVSNWIAVPPTSPGDFWRLVLIDHGGSFREGGLVGSKFYGECRGAAISPHFLEDIKRFAREMPAELNDLLSTEARVALRGRAIELASTGTIPTDSVLPVDRLPWTREWEETALRRQRRFASSAEPPTP